MSDTFPPHAGVRALLDQAHILITGATGFVGKVLLEKILRTVPNIHTIYVLIRPKGEITAQKRMNEEIINSLIFTELQYSLGGKQAFLDYVKNKVVAISGDISYEQCGISELNKRLLAAHCSVIFHCAASIDFEERVDRAVELNVRGALRTYNLALSFDNCRAFVHVSTAYVNCNQPSGSTIEEKLYDLGFEPEEMLTRISQMSETQLQNFPASGMLRTWPNTYTFTKSITEHILVRTFHATKGKVPLAICRPSIVTSAWKEPLPGWVDDISAASAVYAGIAQGLLHFAPGRPYNVLDFVPVDLVVNAILLSASFVSQNSSQTFICHAGSSGLFPMQIINAMQSGVRYMTSQPYSRKMGPVKFALYDNRSSFETRFFLQYELPLEVIKAVSFLGTKKQRSNADRLSRIVGKAKKLISSFGFFQMNEWIFQASNTASLAIFNENVEEHSVFYFNYEGFRTSYYSCLIAYGVMKFALGNEADRILISRESAENTRLDANNEGLQYIDERRKLKPPSTPLPYLFPDISLLSQKFLFNPGAPVSFRDLIGLRAQVFDTSFVIDAVERYSEKEGISLAQANSEAHAIFDRMIGKSNQAMFLGVAMILRKAFRRLFSSVFVNTKALTQLEKVYGNVPVIYLPTHRSCLDAVLVSFLANMFSFPPPMFASGHEQVETMLARKLFCHWGAFMVSKGVWEEDDLEFVIVSEFMNKLLSRGQSIEFFLESECSKSALMQPLRTDLLRNIFKSYLKGDVPDAFICPVTINYEKTVEYEWEENRFPSGGTLNFILKNFARSFTKISADLGRISVRFSEKLLSLKALCDEFHALYPTVKLDHESSATMNSLVTHAGQSIMREINANIECLPTHIVASLLLATRRGLKRQDLAAKFEWLRQEISERKGRVSFVEGECLPNIIDRALYHLRKVINEPKENMVGPFAYKSVDLQDMLLLSKYRNHILHLFLEEALCAAAFYSFGSQYLDTKVAKEKLVERCQFLKVLFEAELQTLLQGQSIKSVDEILNVLNKRGVFEEVDNQIFVLPAGDVLFSFLCSMCWPLLDSYYVVACSLFKLKSSRTMQDILLLSEAQTLGISFFRKNLICFYENFTPDIVRNALNTFEKMQVVKFERIHEKKRSNGKLQLVQSVLVNLNTPYNDEKRLFQWIDQIGSFCLPSPSTKSMIRIHINSPSTSSKL